MTIDSLPQVVDEVSHHLEQDERIHAMWLEGSYATGKFTEGSDIDVWLDVEIGSFDDCINAFRSALEEIGIIDWEKSRGVYSNEPKLCKHTFHLAGFSETQMIELDLQEHGRDFVFEEGTHVIKVLFDKDQTIKWKKA